MADAVRQPMPVGTALPPYGKAAPGSEEKPSLSNVVGCPSAMVPSILEDRLADVIKAREREEQK